LYQAVSKRLFSLSSRCDAGAFGPGPDVFADDKIYGRVHMTMLKTFLKNINKIV
jgi:hypothetical protein